MKNIKRLLALMLTLLMTACASAEHDLKALAAAKEITHDSERYLSVVYTTIEESGTALYENIHAETYARDGVYAGQQLNLSQLLGLEQEDDQEPSVAAQLVYDLIWQIIEADMQEMESDYLEGLTGADVEKAFSPEADFYLDADGNVVFFIQAGEIAGEVAGVLTFPFAPAELLSAIHE